jgi:DHA2 family methylenomycin A resistance protein-like MFS transporter
VRRRAHRPDATRGRSEEAPVAAILGRVPSTPTIRVRRPVRAIVAVCLAMAVVGINTTAIGVTTRGMAGELDIAADTMSWIVGAYLLTAASFSLIGGRLGDVAGRTRTFVAGLAIFALGALGAALSPSTGWLIAARAVEGLGAALVLPASIELVVAHPFATGPRSGFRARGIVYASAFGVGPLVGGLLTDHVTWRAIFWLELVLLAVALVLALPLLGRTSTLPHPRTRDVRGAVLSAVLVAVALGAVARVPTAWGWWSWPMAVAVAVTTVLAVALVHVERRTDHPLLHGRALTDRIVVGANVATLAASIGMIGLLYFFNLFAQSAAVFDSAALSVAVAFVPFTVSIILFAFVAGRLSGRLGYRGPVLVGLGLTTVGFFWLSTTSGATTEAQLIVPLALCGVGAGIANAGLTTPAVLTLPRTRLDESAGLFSLSRYVGSALAIAIGTSTYLSVAAAPPPADLPPEEVAMGRSAFQRALDTLDDDLRSPFEAVAREQSAAGFATTMRVAGTALAGLTLVSIVLLRPEPEERDPAPLLDDARSGDGPS